MARLVGTYSLSRKGINSIVGKKEKKKRDNENVVPSIYESRCGRVSAMTRLDCVGNLEHCRSVWFFHFQVTEANAKAYRSDHGNGAMTVDLPPKKQRLKEID